MSIRHKFILLSLGIALLAVVGYLNWTLLATPPSPVPVMPGASNLKVEDYKLGRVDGVLTSYTVGVTPDAVHEFYRTALPGVGWPYVAPGQYSPANSIAEQMGLPATSLRACYENPQPCGLRN